MTDRAAEKACKEQNKKLLNDKAEVKQFISYFPGENEKERLFNFVNLFGLEKTGYWYPYSKKWTDVGSVSCAKVSRLSRVFGYGRVYGEEWYDTSAGMDRNGQSYPSPFVACEDCAA